MAQPPVIEERIPPHPGWALFHRATTPRLVYWLAGWRRPSEIGDGRLVVRVHGRGSARLYYRNPVGEDRIACERRRAWIARVPARCGASRVTLREAACLADGEGACDYLVTWTDRARVLPALAGGLVVALVLAVIRSPSIAVLPGLAVSVVAYAVGRSRVARANTLATAQSGAAFRSLLGHALEATTGASDPRCPGLSMERQGDTWRVEYGATILHLRHSRGLAFLAHLVRNAGQEIHVSTLDAITPSAGSGAARSAADPSGAPGAALHDAGEILDTQARAEYRRRVVELREALEDAEAHADVRRAETMRAELETLEDEPAIAPLLDRIRIDCTC